MGLEHSPWERSCSPVSVLCCVPFLSLCGLTKYTVAGTAFGPTLTVCMLAIDPVDSQVLFAPGHQCRYTEVRSQDCSRHAPGHSVGTVEAVQTLAWPNHHVYVPTKPTAAKASPVPVAGVLVLLGDSQVLNLGSRQQRCNSTSHTAARRYFSSSSLLTRPLGLRCGFSPTSACGPRAQESVRQEGAEVVIRVSRPPRWGEGWWRM